MEKSKITTLGRRLRERLRRPLGITWYCALLSLFTTLAYHAPLMEVVCQNTQEGASGAVIVGSFVVLIFVVNFLVYCVLAYLLRVVGRVLMALMFVVNGIALYFINTYEVLLTREMMGNVFNTQYSEASGYFGLNAAMYVLLIGIVPAIYVLLRRVDYGSMRRFVVSIVGAIAVVAGIAAVNVNNILWIDRNATQVGSLVLPWSYVVNSVRYFHHQHMLNREAILLPDAEVVTSGRDVVVLVIGESARRENFSLYGYSRETNPLLARDSVTSLVARASATYTTEGVRAILSHRPTEEYYEPLPDYLARAGVDVKWRTSNWGEPQLHLADYRKVRDIKALYPAARADYDEILFHGLRDDIAEAQGNKLLVVIHTSTSHGPEYYKRYPAEFERFTPACRSVEMANADRAELINAYDNTILYVDHLLHGVIATLKGLEGVRSTMIYVSDHGESLGEGNLYMHGMPMSMAPREQVEIPFIVWTSDSASLRSDIGEVGHYHVFHSIISRLGVASPVYDPKRDIFFLGQE